LTTSTPSEGGGEEDAPADDGEHERHRLVEAVELRAAHLLLAAAERARQLRHAQVAEVCKREGPESVIDVVHELEVEEEREVEEEDGP